MIMTQAFNDMSQYNDDMPLEVRHITQASECKRLKNEIKDLKRTLQINKEIINSLVSESGDATQELKKIEKERTYLMKTLKDKNEEVNNLNDRCLILEQIKSFHEKASEDMEQQ